MEITTITAAQTIEDLILLVEAENERYEWLKSKVSKMPKAKALELIARAYPEYETTEVYEVYTAKANLEAAHGTITAAAGIREVALKTAEVVVEEPKLPTKSIGTLLIELANTRDAKLKKNIRAALRRQGYKISQQPKEDEAK